MLVFGGVCSVDWTEMHVCGLNVAWEHHMCSLVPACWVSSFCLSIYLSVVAVAPPPPSWPWPPFPHAVPVLPPVLPCGKLCHVDGGG